MEETKIFVDVTDMYAILTDNAGNRFVIHRNLLEQVNRQLRAAATWLDAKKRAVEAQENNNKDPMDPHQGDNPECESPG